MAEEFPDKWSQDNNSCQDFRISTNTSSFEALDPHDPNLSRLATALFQKTSDYLTGELTATQRRALKKITERNLGENVKSQEDSFSSDLTKDHYNLLEEINRTAITKYADLRQISVNLGKTINEYNVMFNTTIKPLLLQIDCLEEQVTKFETAAYALDAYTKQLKARFKELEEK